MPLDDLNRPPRGEPGPGPERRYHPTWPHDEYSIVERCLDQIERTLCIRLTACERADSAEHLRTAFIDFDCAVHEGFIEPPWLDGVPDGDSAG
jgi:hypothetical protein